MAFYKQGLTPVGAQDRLDGGSVPDTAMDPDSTNSLQNKIITEQINQINEDLAELERRGAMPELDYANPLHTFSSGNLTYTATKDCYLCGNITTASATASITVDGTVIWLSGTGEIITSFINPLLIKSGSTVVLNWTASSLHIFDLVS